LNINTKDSLLVVFSSDIIGHFTKTIYVFSNSINNPEILHIKGVVMEDEKGLIK